MRLITQFMFALTAMNALLLIGTAGDRHLRSGRRAR